jgi:phenylalanyl-tRNA synthetase beta chain
MVGLAREIHAITGAPLRYPVTSMEKAAGSNPVRVELENSSDCSRYAACFLTGVKTGPTPEWIKRRLEVSGIRSINNVVDITNYVLVEYGHPLHPFDADRICDKTIMVRSARPGEKFVTLDGVERTLDPDMLMVADPEKSVALAGIMGGKDTEVDGETCNILLESAYFRPSSIRKTSRRLGLTTEASYRFERGCDPDNVIRALNRAAYMILETAGGKAQGETIDCYPKPISPIKVILRLARLRQILGAKIPAADAVNILKRLGLIIESEQVRDEEIQILIPPFRPDLTREIDLIEEVARIYGYENIPPTLPSGIQNQVPPDKIFALTEEAKIILAGLGFFEGINFTFTSKSNFSKLILGMSDESFLRLENPLNVEQDLLRVSLIPSLLENLAGNLRWNRSDIKLFEISSCYVPSDGSFEERRLLAGIMAGFRDVKYWKDERRDVDFYDVKGIVEVFLEEFGVNDFRFTEVDCAFLHPKKSLQVFCGQDRLGILGEFNSEFGSIAPGNVFLFELDFSAVLAHRKEEKRFAALRKFPGIVRDLAVVVPDRMTVSQVFGVIEAYKSELLEKVELLSIYTGSPIEKGYKSIAFSLFYQSDQRTLVDEEVDRLHGNIAERLQEKLGVKLR